MSLSLSKLFHFLSAKKMVSELASGEGRAAGLAAAQKAAEEEIVKQDLTGMTKDKVSALRVLFQQIGATAGTAAGGGVAKAVLGKINMEALLGEVRAAAGASGEKYAVKAREFQKLATKIAEDAGGKAGEKLGEQEGGVSGEEAGEISGGEAGRTAGQVCRKLHRKLQYFAHKPSWHILLRSLLSLENR